MNNNNIAYTPSAKIPVISGITIAIIALAAFSQSGDNVEQIDKAFAVGVTLLFCVAASIILYIVIYRKYFFNDTTFQVSNFWGRTEIEVRYDEIDKVLDLRAGGNVNVTLLKKDGETIQLNVGGIEESVELLRTLRERVYVD